MPLKKSAGPIVGLDIGSNFIKACEIDCRGGRAQLRGIAVLPTPPEAVVNSEITDPVSLGKMIKQLLAQSGIKAKKVITSVAGQSSLVVRIIEVPKMTRAELQETMKWEIERHVPFANEPVVMDYQPLVPPDEVPDGQNMEILLAVVQENRVNRQVETVQAAGLQPVAIDIEPLATSRSLLDLANGAGPQGTVAIIDIGASTTDISIYKEGRIAFTRSIQIAGSNLTKAIADVLGQPLADAERLKKDLAGIPEVPRGDAGLEPFGGDLGGLDFGFGAPGPDAPVLGGVLGGTFGASPTASTGTTTATDTHSEPAFDIAGGGFSTDAFTTPSEPEGAPQPGAAPEASPFAMPGSEPTGTFAAPGADSATQSPFAMPTEGAPTGASPFDPAAAPFGAPAPSPFGAGLGGPIPAGNPFDPDAGAPPAAPAANPFDTSLFGPAPGADPFGAGADFGLGGLPPAAPAPAGGPAGPAPMSEEDYLRTQIADAIMPVLHELVTELRRSLDFYRNRANGLGAQQVLICGGTAKLPGLAEFLTANLEAPVAVANPLQYLSAAPKSDAQYLQDVGPVFPVSVGLAVRELMAEPPASRKKR